MSDDDFLRRWSRRKIQARKGEALEEPPKPAEPAAPPAPAQAAPQPAIPEEPPLPPVESLTPDSDFTPFMRPKVDGSTRNAALKTLFKDARYNVMDGLDVYIDDYSKPDPLPEGWLEKLNQVARLGDWQPPAEAEKEPEEPAGTEASPDAEEAAPKNDMNSLS